MTNETNKQMDKSKYIEEVLKNYCAKSKKESNFRQKGVDFIYYGLSLKEQVEFIEQALLKQQEIIKECLPVVEESIEMDGSAIFNRGKLGYRNEFLDNLKKRGINLE